MIGGGSWALAGSGMATRIAAGAARSIRSAESGTPPRGGQVAARSGLGPLDQLDMSRVPDAGGDPGVGRARQLAPRRLPASRGAPAHRGSGRSEAASHPERSARPARAQSRPLPGKTRCRQELISELGTPSAELAGQAREWTEHETAAAVTAVTAKTPLQITCPRRSPGAARLGLVI